jgi:DNA-binding phage protein
MTKEEIQCRNIAAKVKKKVDQMKAGGMSKTELISKTGLSNRTFYTIMDGKSNFNILSLLRVCNAIGLKVDIK